MRYVTHKWALVVGLALAVGACRKTQPVPVLVLPAETQTGAQTLGFELDGQVWTNYGRRCTIYGCRDNRVRSDSHTYTNRFVDVVGHLTHGKTDQTFRINMDSVPGPGRYVATRLLPPPSSIRQTNFAFVLTDHKQGSYHATLRPQGARITITKLDTAQRIVAGTFEGEIEDTKSPGRFKQIRNGRFDLKYD